LALPRKEETAQERSGFGVAVARELSRSLYELKLGLFSKNISEGSLTKN